MVPDTGRQIDLSVVGPVFLDLVFTGLPRGPQPGLEVRSTGLGISPGGVANTAVAAARLGLSVRLETDIGKDVNGEYIWSSLSSEGIDLRGTRRLDGWATPVTVSLAYDSDRSMVTYEDAAPPKRSVDIDRGEGTSRALLFSLPTGDLERIEAARRQGSQIFADTGWDESERWFESDLDALGLVDVFLPNQVEAMSYTHASSPEAAAQVLARRVPLVVVKCGSDGAVAARAGERSIVRAPALDVSVVDTTGAGDVFDAAFIASVLFGWSLEEGLAFANLCAGLSVASAGGSQAAPDLSDIGRWLGETPERAKDFRSVAALVNGRPRG